MESINLLFRSFTFMTTVDDFWRFLLSVRDRVTIDGFIGSKDNSGTKLERNDNVSKTQTDGVRVARNEKRRRDISWERLMTGAIDAV